MKWIWRFLLVVALAFAAPPSACASSIWKRMTNSDGLFDFLFGGSDEIATPVERISGYGGQIASAHLRAYGKNVFVSGLVRRQSLCDPPPWSHVDVIVLDSHKRVVEATMANYMPRDIPHGQRGTFPQSRFIARLASLPPAGATVKVVFNARHRTEGGYTTQPRLGLQRYFPRHMCSPKAVASK